jgi:hypothetical protein
MNPFAIKCYLPGRRTQYVLYPSEDMSIELGAGADLCPRGFDSQVRVQFRLVGEQWFVVPQLGEIRTEDGGLIDGPCAVSFPAMLLAGSAALVLDQAMDPRMPARVLQGVRDTERSEPVPPGPAPIHTLPRVSARTPAERTRARFAQVRGSAAVSLAFDDPQPRVAGGQPQVAPLGRAPALAPVLEPSIVVQQAEQPPVRELTETRVIDMTELGLPAKPGQSAASEPPSGSPAAALSRLKQNPRLMAYAVLGVALVALQFGLRAHNLHARARATAAQTVAAVVPAASAVAESAKPTRAPVDLVEPLAPGELPSAQRAGELYATGDFRGALRQYRALRQIPAADPVFAVVAHALEQRLHLLGQR